MILETKFNACETYTNVVQSDINLIYELQYLHKIFKDFTFNDSFFFLSK